MMSIWCTRCGATIDQRGSGICTQCGYAPALEKITGGKDTRGGRLFWLVVVLGLLASVGHLMK